MQTDLDGLHVELSANLHLLTEAQRGAARTLLFVGGLAVAVLLYALFDSGIAFVFLLMPYLGWLALDDVRILRAVSQHVTLGAHTLSAAGRNITFDVPWVDVGRVAVRGGISPVLHLNVHQAPPIRIPMENEPVEHAVWLKTAIEDRARCARELAGAASEIPDALRPLRATE